MYDIVSVGGITTDLIVRSARLPSPGTCVTATSLHRGLGGKAANQAVAAARLGGRVALVGCVGDDDAGREALRRLADERIGIEHVARCSNVATGAVVLHRNDAGEKQAVVFPGANAELRPQAIDAVSPLLAAARVVLLQLEIPLETVERVVETIRAGEARLVLDASPVRANLRVETIRAAAVVKANAAEASAISGIRVCDAASARAAAARLLEIGAGLVVLEAGRDGNLFASRSEEMFLPLHEMTAADPTGAGDALVGAFAVAMVEGRPLREAAERACAAAALATRTPRAQSAMPSRAELDEWLAAH